MEALALAVVIFYSYQSCRQANSNEVAANAARQAADAASNAVTEAKISREESTRQATLARESSEKQSRDAARASERQSKAALDASIAASRNDQRAWVTVSRFALSKEPDSTGPFFMSYWFVNSGRSPALSVTSQTNVIFSDGVPALTDFPQVGPLAARVMLPPAPVERQSPNVNFLLPQYATRYRNHEMTMFVHILIRYADIYGRPHWTRVCVKHTFGTALDDVSYCENGNDMDQ
jgi:hypothetical protein